jgi:hypothetical protein
VGGEIETGRETKEINSSKGNRARSNKGRERK